MPYLRQFKQHSGRISPLSQSRRDHGGSYEVHSYVRFSTVVVWASVVIWGCVLWFCDWQRLRTPQAEIRSAVIEGVRPPVPLQMTTWSELHASDTTSKVEVKPRTFPENYASIPFIRDLNANSETPPMATEERRHLPTFEDSCKPASAWHSYTFPTCNSMHEIDMLSGLASVPDVEDDPADRYIEYMFSGGTRESWLVHPRCSDGEGCALANTATSEPKVILKTLRWPIEHDEVVYEHQRIDALASERLTASPHVIDIYGFCGVSALNEFADGGNFRKMFMQSHMNVTDAERLAYARDAALALADIHEIDDKRTTMVHHDFSAKNFLTVGGKLKVSDFNDGQLLRWDFEKKQRCFGFNWDGLCGNNTERTNRRAPEECMGDKYRRLTSEKVEVYHLGVLFFLLLTGEEWPYYFQRSSSGVQHKPKSPKVKKLILEGKQPTLPLEVEMSNSTATKTMIEAMTRAFTFEPKKRPSARKIAEFLIDASNKMEGKRI